MEVVVFVGMKVPAVSSVTLIFPVGLGTIVSSIELADGVVEL